MLTHQRSSNLRLLAMVFALGTLTVALVVLIASPAWAVLQKAADWQMNEPPGSGQMIDSSANNNNGTPTDVVQTGEVYVFNGSTSRVVVPDNDTLDPADKDITLTARLMVNGGSLDDDSYDIVRKGLSTTPGGDYKMEIKATGRLHCYFRGTGGIVHKVARVNILDGSWHTLECIKTTNSVVARVDGGRSYKATGTAGSITNSSNIMVGGKKTNPFDDMFDGSMDFVSIDIDR
jgi:hypothetical protein